MKELKIKAMSDNGNIVLKLPRPWLIWLLRLLRLSKFSWAQRVSYRHIKRMVIGFDPSTHTITVDKPFPLDRTLEGKYIVEAEKR